jgi:predicted membrane-bound dolichyl-phosphate-mannose-protein mannosyltransferase
VVSPPILVLALPALGYGAWSLARGAAGGDLERIGIAWFLGTFVPFALLSLLGNRTSYLYYMVIVMPAIYVAVSAMFARGRFGSRTITVYACLVLGAAVALYPFTPTP